MINRHYCFWIGILGIILGILISLVGLLVGLLGHTWTGLIMGLSVLGIGIVVHEIPFINLFFLAYKTEAKLNQINSTDMVGKGIPWENIYHRFFTVTKFTPNASVSGNTVRANSSFEPYAMLMVESQDSDIPIFIPVNHRLDFLNLWRLFNEQIVTVDEEVIVTYDPDKWYRRSMPHLPIYIAPKNTVKKLADISSLPISESGAMFDSLKRYWDPPHPGRDLYATIYWNWRVLGMRFKKRRLQ